MTTILLILSLITGGLFSSTEVDSNGTARLQDQPLER